MGIYLNPQHQTKEQWLFDNAINLTSAGIDPHAALLAFDQDNWPIVWVENSHFTAAAVAHNQAEYRRLISRNPPGRPLEVWCCAKFNILGPVSPAVFAEMEKECDW